MNILDNPMISGTVEINTPKDFPKILVLVKEMKAKAERIKELIKVEPFDNKVFDSGDNDLIIELGLKYMNGKYIILGGELVCIHLADEIAFWHLSMSQVEFTTGNLYRIKDDLSNPLCLAFLGENYHEGQKEIRTEIRHFFIRKS